MGCGGFFLLLVLITAKLPEGYTRRKYTRLNSNITGRAFVVSFQVCTAACRSNNR